jgi:hypothetical protein
MNRYGVLCVAMNVSYTLDTPKRQWEQGTVAHTGWSERYKFTRLRRAHVTSYTAPVTHNGGEELDL